VIYNVDRFNSTTLNNRNIETHRQCGNCKKTYQFYDIKKNFPEFCHKELKQIWQSPEIEFYCSYCYLIKLIRNVKDFKFKNRNNELDIKSV